MSNIIQQPFFGSELGQPSNVYCRNVVLDGLGVGTVFSVGSISILLRNGGGVAQNVFTTTFTDFTMSPTTTTGTGSGMVLTISMAPFYILQTNLTASNSSPISITVTNAGTGYVAGDQITITRQQLRDALGAAGQGVLPEPFLSADLSGSIFSGDPASITLKLGNNLDFVQNEVPPTINGGGRADVNRGETGWQFSVGQGLEAGREATINLIIPAKSETSSNQIDYTSDKYDVVVDVTGTTNLYRIIDPGDIRSAICPKDDGTTWISILRDPIDTLSPAFMTVRLVKRELQVL
jgi:hypothetical protein